MNKGRAFCSAELLLCFLLITVAVLHQTCAANNQQTCAPSSCGQIPNIRKPFRLKDDPQSCGDPRYELACENNMTVLYKLFPGTKYYVQEIDYRNFRIRLVDAGISGADCSSLPRYFLSSANFSDSYMYEYAYNNSASYEATQIGDPLFGHVIYLNCSKPVRDDPQYVDTTPCVNWHSKGHIYAIAGDLSVADFKADCRVMLVAASSSPLLRDPRGYYSSLSHNNNHNFSFPEIHRMLSYGFDVLWESSPCEHTCRRNSYCYLDESRNIRCGTMIWRLLRIIAIEYVIGFLKGIFLFANQKKDTADGAHKDSVTHSSHRPTM